MKHSLKNKILIGVPVVFIVVMLAVILVITTIHSKQSRKEADTLLKNAFSIIRYTISEKESDLLDDFQQAASLNDMGGMIKYITDNRPFFKYSIMRPTYIKMADLIHNTNIITDVYTTCIYDTNGILIAFSFTDKNKSTSGYVHNHENIEIASLEPDEELTYESWQQRDKLPASIEYHFNEKIPNKEIFRFKVIDDILCLVAYIPIMGKDYNPATENMEPKQTGLAVVIQKFDNSFAKKMTELSNTVINIHTRNSVISADTTNNHNVFNFDTLKNTQSKLTLNGQALIYDDIEMAGIGYYRAILPVYSDSQCIAVIDALYSKAGFHANTSQIIKLLSIIYFIGIMLIVPATILLVIRGIINPIKKIAAMMRQIADKKDFTKMLDIEREDEIGELAASFNEMTSNLRETTTSIDNLNREIAKRKKTQDELNQSEEKYKLQIEEAMDAIITADAETGIIVDCNNAATKLVGRRKSELIGQSQQILHPSEKIKSEADNTFVQHLHDKVGQVLETQVITKSGVIKDVAIKANLLQIGDKKILQGIFRDITENKKAEETLRRSETKFRTLYDTTSDAVMLMADGKFFDCNKAALRIYGCADPKEFCSKHPADLSPPKQPCGEDSLTLANKQLAIAMEKGSNHFEWVHKRVDTGKEFIADVLINTMELDGKTVFHTVVRDITERKQAEENMNELNRELEQAVKKLEETNQEMKNFVYIASHDLREPLRKVVAFGDILYKSLAGKLSDDDAENLHFMTDGANRMYKMIEGLLIYSRVSTQTQPTQTVDMNEIVEQLRKFELSVVLEEKNVVVDVPQPLPAVEVDPVQIRQLMHNLVANGIKYQPKDRAPHITITSKPAANGMVRIEVTDNGIGIAPEYQSEIFAMFKRLHTKNEYEGTGIGLSVCKKIVERHGGQIGIESQPDKGSTFWFTIQGAKNVVPVATA